MQAVGRYQGRKAALIAHLDQAVFQEAPISTCGKIEAESEQFPAHLIPQGKRTGVIAVEDGEYHADIAVGPDELNVTVLQDRVLTPLLGLTPEKVAAGGHLTYVKQLPAALEEVSAGREQIAFILEDLPVEGVARVSFAGQVLPQKSTFFYPKLGSGLVMYPLD